MSDEIISSNHIVGLSAILGTFNSHGVLTEAELLSVCSRYGLRAGGVPWTGSLSIARQMKLVLSHQNGLQASKTGAALGSLVGTDLEPTEEFAQAITLMVLGRSPQRLTLIGTRLELGTLEVASLTGTDLLDTLSAIGLLSRTEDGAWTIQNSPFSALLVGLLLAPARANQATHEVGRIGEELTLRFYQEQGCTVYHVSKIADSFGFDILCCPTTNRLPQGFAVEAKGTTGAGELRFFFSSNELRVSKYLGNDYLIVLWGEIDAQKTVDENYRTLVARGYPHIIRNPYEQIATSERGLVDGFPSPAGMLAPDGIVWTVTR